MIERPVPANPRIRAGSQPHPVLASPRHWMQNRAPGLRTLTRQRQRRERAWAWLSLVVLIVCWDASSRLDQPAAQASASQNALIPVSARPTVSW